MALFHHLVNLSPIKTGLPKPDAAKVQKKFFRRVPLI